MGLINRLTNKPEKFWVLVYIDLDKKTFNPGLEVSNWDTVREIEKITCKLQKEGRNVRISTTKTVFNIDGLLSQEEHVNAGPEECSYDPFLMW